MDEKLILNNSKMNYMKIIDQLTRVRGGSKGELKCFDMLSSKI